MRSSGPRPGAPVTWVCTEIAPIFESAESDEVLRNTKVGEVFTLAGPIKVVDGFSMVPVEPRGAIETRALRPKRPTLEEWRRARSDALKAKAETPSLSNTVYH